jgi:hypothetical protein
MRIASAQLKCSLLQSHQDICEIQVIKYKNFHYDNCIKLSVISKFVVNRKVKC